MISMAMAALPHEKVVNWMMTFGASCSAEMDNFVLGNSCCEGDLSPSQALRDVDRSKVLGMKPESF